MEGNKKFKPRAILVFGAPASGKTTFCEKFSARFKAPYYDLDDLRARGGLNDSQLKLVLEIISKSGQNIVIEGCLATSTERKVLKRWLKAVGFNPSLVWIQTDITTIKSRLKTKLKDVKKAKEVLDTEVARLEAPTEAEKPIILSGKHTFDTQLSHTLAQLH